MGKTKATALNHAMASTKAKRRGRRKDPLDGKRDPVSQLYRAVKRYVEHHKGTVVVIGGIQIEQPLGGRELNYHVTVRCLGKLPSFSPNGTTKVSKHE